MTKGIHITDLPSCIAAEIAKHLTARDQTNLACSCKRLNKIIEATQNKCDIIVFENHTLRLVSKLLKKRPNVSSLKIILSFDKMPVLQYLSGSQNLRDLSIQFTKFNASPRGIKILCSNFSNLHSLQLKSSSQPKKRLNLDGNLSSLSSLNSLNTLYLHNLGSDQGLQHLNQVTSLHITYPSHGETSFSDISCSYCGEIHQDDFDEFWSNVDIHAAVILGHRLGNMQNLKHLVLDFNVHRSLSANSILNMFRWSDKKCFPSLVRIDFLNNGPRDGVFGALYEHLHEEELPDILLPKAGKSTDMYLTCNVWNAYRCMPRLMHWCLPVSGSDIERLGESGKVWFCGNPVPNNASNSSGDHEKAMCAEYVVCACGGGLCSINCSGKAIDVLRPQMLQLGGEE